MSDDQLKRILVVDDEEIIRNVCKRSLQKKGYEVEVAEHGVQALDMIEKNDYPVVVTDLKMPLMDGNELLEVIKRDHVHVEVVMMTAYATLEGAIDAMKKGACDFLLKPIKPDQVRLVVDKCFERIALDRENEALRTANKKLAEVQEMKDKFIAITSHELRTPVSHLKGYLGILDDDFFEHISADERKHCMDVLNKAVSNLEQIVTSMYRLDHLEKKDWPLEREEIDINNVIDGVFADFDVLARKRNHKLSVEKTSEVATVLSDEKQLKSMLTELVQNAVKFTPDGGEIKISARIEEGYCVLSVADNGIGIAPEEQGKIFEKFYEVQNSNYHSSSKNAFLGGGLGIGLPSVKAIVQAMGGRVKVKSQLSQGSEFQVYLPLAHNRQSKPEELTES